MQQSFDLGVIATLQRSLDRQALTVAANRYDRQCTPGVTINHRGVTFRETARQFDCVP